jgi:hypothetical protein
MEYYFLMNGALHLEDAGSDPWLLRIESLLALARSDLAGMIHSRTEQRAGQSQSLHGQARGRE